MTKTLKDCLMNGNLNGLLFKHTFLTPEEYFLYEVKSLKKKKGKILLRMNYKKVKTERPLLVLQPLSRHLEDNCINYSQS